MEYTDKEKSSENTLRTDGERGGDAQDESPRAITRKGRERSRETPTPRRPFNFASPSQNREYAALSDVDYQKHPSAGLLFV